MVSLSVITDRLISLLFFLLLLLIPTSVTAKKICPIDGKVYPDSAKYCGVHGVPLKAKPTHKPYKDSVTGMEFVFVKGGCYQMGDTFGDGSPNEKPVHEVCVDDFFIGKYEVTQGQWREIMGKNPSRSKDCGDNCPVERLSWNDLQEFIKKLNQKTGKKYRLPTEAEWEYAARSGGKREKYSGGDDVDAVAWYSSNSGNKIHPVGTKSPNGLEIYDMSGNVWEWVTDWYAPEYYNNSPRNNPEGPDSGSSRVLRGGSWSYGAWSTRSARRLRSDPDLGLIGSGFRVARTN
jgi:formylglycine-generating enzyme required for sulfatase activity